AGAAAASVSVTAASDCAGAGAVTDADSSAAVTSDKELDPCVKPIMIRESSTGGLACRPARPGGGGVRPNEKATAPDGYRGRGPCQTRSSYLIGLLRAPSPHGSPRPRPVSGRGPATA